LEHHRFPRFNFTVTDLDPAVPPALQDEKTLPIVVYALTLAGLITGGVTSVIAVILAYVSRKGAPDWLQSHYTFAIRTFWLSLLFGIIGGALTVIGIGIFLLAALGVWIAVRSIIGLSFLLKGQAYPTPKNWML
jgi:uncharacterized membrane protein